MLHGVAKCHILNMPCCGIIGSYGGGDANKVASPLLAVSKYKGSSPLVIGSRKWLEVLPPCINEVYSEQGHVDSFIPLPAFNGITGFEWSSHLVITGAPAQTSESDSLNVMYHGWLFHDELVKDPNREGISKWPLIGLFDSVNLKFDVNEGVRCVGDNRLVPSDQHVHLVKEIIELDGIPMEFQDWRTGSDMAKFRAEPAVGNQSGNQDRKFAHTWMVCVDLEQKKCDVSLLILVTDKNEEKNIKNRISELEFRPELEISEQNVFYVLQNVDNELKQRIKHVWQL